MISLGAIYGERVVVGARECHQVVCVRDVRDIPAIAGKAIGYVFVEGEIGIALDRDVVAVVNPAQVRKLQVTCDEAASEEFLPSCRRRRRVPRCGG